MFEYISAPEAAKNGAFQKDGYRSCVRTGAYWEWQNSAVCGSAYQAACAVFWNFEELADRTVCHYCCVFHRCRYCRGSCSGKAYPQHGNY